MTSRRIGPALLLAAGALVAPAHLAAQPAPQTGEFSLCPSTAPPGYTWTCESSGATALANGTFGIGEFGDYRDPEIYVYWRFFARAEVVDTAGRRLRRATLDTGSVESDFYPEQPRLAPYGSDGFMAAWHTILVAESDIRMWWPALEPFDYLTASDSLYGLCCWSPRIASNPAGQAVVAWHESQGCQTNALTSVGLRAFAPSGQPATPILHIVPVDPASRVEQPRVLMETSGRFRAIWTERGASSAVLRGQRFTRDGRLLGTGFSIAEDGTPLASAILPDGTLVAVWRLRLPAPDGSSFWLQRYAADGRPLGLPRTDPGLAPGSGTIEIAHDVRGNLALLWTSGAQARLFNRELVPQGAAFDVGPAGSSAESIALADSGSFITVRSQGAPGDQHPVARIWQARHDADACVRRGPLFLCDTANDGAAAEASLPLGEGKPQEIPFLADWDGDGRADPCLYRNGRFFCDTDHAGGTDVRSPMVGTSGDLPLLGDLNGDGKADPCVRRGAAVLCDLARDGGAKELRIVFGTAGDKVFLGDPDGNGKDDPCLLRDGRLLCDTAHDGGLAELRLDLRPLHAQGPTLFGDVNGDGRDEACRFTGTRFVCGVYPAGGGVPASRIEIVFGRPGDVPVLGDLDAF